VSDFPKPSARPWTQHDPNFGTGPISPEESIWRHQPKGSLTFVQEQSEFFDLHESLPSGEQTQALRELLHGKHLVR
jgi:hypothetical protein